MDVSLTLIPIVVALVWAALSTASNTSVGLRRKLLTEFKLVAEEMDLQCDLEDADEQIVLRGRRENIEVEGRVQLKGAGTGIVSARPSGLSPEIRLLDPVSRSNLLGSDGFADYLSGDAFEDTKIGDPHFDALIVVRGPLPDLYAALTQSARSALTTLVAHDGFLLTDGQLQIHLTERDGSWMRRNFASLLRAARHLVMDEGRAARFLGNYKAEKNPLIALRNAVFLLREEAGSPEAAEVTELLLDEGAARFLGLGESPEWPGVLATLAMRRPERGASLIEGFLERQLHPGQSVHEGGLAKIAVVLGGLKAPVARPLIWRVLDSDPPGSVRVMAVTSLGRVGAVADVERLRSLSSGVFGAQLRDVIDDAVAAIQGRVETGEGGGLALMEEADDAGGLSVAAEEGGLSKSGGVEQP